MSTTGDVGTIGENLIINDLLKHHCKVYKEVTANQDVDLVVDNGHRFFRIQIKTVTSGKKGAIPVFCVRRRRDKHGKLISTKYTSSSVDVIAVAELDHGIVVYVPIIEFVDKDTLSLRFQPARNKQKKATRNIIDFDIRQIIGV